MTRSELSTMRRKLRAAIKRRAGTQGAHDARGVPALERLLREGRPGRLRAPVWSLTHGQMPYDALVLSAPNADGTRLVWFPSADEIVDRVDAWDVQDGAASLGRPHPPAGGKQRQTGVKRWSISYFGRFTKYVESLLDGERAGGTLAQAVTQAKRGAAKRARRYGGSTIKYEIVEVGDWHSVAASGTVKMDRGRRAAGGKQRAAAPTCGWSTRRALRCGRAAVGRFDVGADEPFDLCAGHVRALRRRVPRVRALELYRAAPGRGLEDLAAAVGKLTR